MNKKILIISFLLVSVLLVGCSSKKETSSIGVLQVKNLLLENDTYGLKGVSFGEDINATEKALHCSFPKIPFLSEEWYSGGIPTEDDIKDYRNLKDYDFVEYAVYDENQPLNVTYEENQAYMTCEFQKGGLKAIYYYFGTGTSRRDSMISFKKDQKDPLEIRQQLLEDLTSQYGEPEIKEAISGNQEPQYVWDRNNTRILLAIDPNSNWCILALIQLK